MERPRFRWCRQAVEQVRFKPDRDKIRNELLDHLEDRIEAMTDRGYSEEEAEVRAVAAMGNPEEVGKQLNAVHKPWLGWLWMASRMLVIALLFTALTFVPGIIGDYKDEVADESEGWRGFREENMPMNTYCTDLYDLELTAEIDGYQVTVDKAAWWSSESGGAVQLYIQVDIRRPLFSEALAQAAIENFYIEDDQGLCVGAFETHPDDYDPAIGLHALYSSYDQKRAGDPFLSECLFSFNAFVWDPEWVDLCYEYGGRVITFRIPGPGGGDT